jgi:hypothetical protein
MPESLDSKGINEIVNTTPLSQGGEGVKCASAEVTEQIGKAHANIDRELAAQVTPSTPAKVGAKHKEFKKGDQVVIAEVGSIRDSTARLFLSGTAAVRLTTESSLIRSHAVASKFVSPFRRVLSLRS